MHLILAERDGKDIKSSSLGAVQLARAVGGPYAFVLLGDDLADLAEGLRFFGAAAVVVVEHPALAEPLAGRCANVLAAAARERGARSILASTSTFTKDVLPRAAALLDAPMLTDVTAVETHDGVTCYRRPIHAGSTYATVRLHSDLHVLTARGTAFRPPDPDPDMAASPVETMACDAEALSDGMTFVSREVHASSRPDLAEARVVVGGGRPLQDEDTFERLIGGLADTLGGAIGATRAAVDAGMAPNDHQIGQTGQVIAPELYIAVGISGAIQHLAGITESRVIVAINRDPDASIFQIASYGLVGDLNGLVPELINTLRASMDHD